MSMSNLTCKACIELSDLQRGAAALALAAVLTACSSTPPPKEQLEAARAAVSQAQPVAVRDGAAELTAAQIKLSRAQQEMERGEYASARMLAEQAEVDARYAWTLAENARVQRAAVEANQSAKQLRDELERSGK
jgi:pectin methylesterase-like acyl-CoA thioesterase